MLTEFGSKTWDRTKDRPLNRRVLYRLSYLGIWQSPRESNPAQQDLESRSPPWYIGDRNGALLGLSPLDNVLGRVAGLYLVRDRGRA